MRSFWTREHMNCGGVQSIRRRSPSRFCRRIFTLQILSASDQHSSDTGGSGSFTRLIFVFWCGSDIRWISARGQGNDADIDDRVMFGIFLDVSQRKQAEEANELLAGEMSHRVMNLLHIATALTQITSRSAATKEDMARELTSRLMALGRAQELVRPITGKEKSRSAAWGLDLHFACPIRREGGQRPDSRLCATKMNVGETSSTTLALVIHELATNSAKYGALSLASGTLDVSCNANDDEVVVMWTERGGPPVMPPIKKDGFGGQIGTTQYGRSTWREYHFQLVRRRRRGYFADEQTSTRELTRFDSTIDWERNKRRVITICL